MIYTILIIELVLVLALIFVAHLEEVRPRGIYRCLYLLPTILATLGTFSVGVNYFYIGLYIACVLEVVALFFKTEKSKRIAAIVSAVLLVAVIINITFNPLYKSIVK